MGFGERKNGFVAPEGPFHLKERVIKHPSALVDLLWELGKVEEAIVEGCKNGK
jgi:hypothetical protein